MSRKSLATLLLLTLVSATPLFAQRRRIVSPASNLGNSLPLLSASQSAAFRDGVVEFTSIEGVEDGLGPVFNGRSCGECHTTPANGGGSTRLVTRFGTTTNGVFDPLAQYGGSLIEDHAIGIADGATHEFAAETVPASATIVAHRRTTPLFGLGYVDATPDQAFIAMMNDELARHDGTAGRVNMVDNISAGMQTVGKFGWKAQVPTLFQFSGDAYLNEMGITSPQFPNENCPGGNCAELAFNPRPDLNEMIDGVQNLANFMTLLAPLKRAPRNADIDSGEQLFDHIGCTACHVQTLHTGPSTVAALDRQEYHPYSDFLLHDMGSLGDGIVQGNAGGNEFRTTPLWGLRFVTAYLHDGRTTSLNEAILAHDGQALSARNRYIALNGQDRNRVIGFLQSL